MAGLLQHLPGANLVRQAWDATRLAGAIIDRRKQKALVLAEERRTQVVQYRGKNATRKVKEILEEGDPTEVARLFVPDAVVEAAATANQVFWRIWDLYWLLALLRIGLVFLPQNGYLHPDEFFQTVEVVSGDALGLDVRRTWEFNATSPLRSMTLPAALFGGPIYALKSASLALNHFFPGVSLVSSYTVLLAPRLAMLVLSFATDFCIYQVCVLYKHSFNRCLATLGSSYVMLVYSTRTLTNSLELALASLLFYLVAVAMKRSSESHLLQSMVKEEYDKAESVREKVKIRKKQRLIPSYDYHCFAPIAIICAAGLFNRPTFAAFAAVPIFFWLQRGLQVHSYFQPLMVMNFRAALLLLTFVATSLVFILTDSLYYGDLTIKKLWELSMEWSDWKVTPVQFVLYNVVPDNLAEHGTHPRYLHALVNIPLLYGPLGLCTLFGVARYFSQVVCNRWSAKPSIRGAEALAAFTFTVGLGALSVFPHQEPRFLIPLTAPAVLLGANLLRTKFGGRRPLLTLWYAFNIGAALVLGLLHQGGVVPAVRWLGEEMDVSKGTTEVSVVFSRTYMPPRFPLLQAAKGSPALPYVHNRPGVRFRFFDLAGADDSEVAHNLTALASRSDYLKDALNTEVLLVAPRHVARDVESETGGKLTFETLKHIFPHLSTESLPNPEFELLFEALSHTNDWRRSLHFVWQFLDVLGDFSLTVQRVKLAGGVKTASTPQTGRAKHS